MISKLKKDNEATKADMTSTAAAASKSFPILALAYQSWPDFDWWHMNVLVSWNAFTFFMVSSIIWFFQSSLEKT